MNQILIALFGVTAVILTQQGSYRLKKWACVFGLLGQPFWMYETYTSGQWGMFQLTLCYTIAWSIGFWGHWIKPRLVARKHRPG